MSIKSFKSNNILEISSQNLTGKKLSELIFEAILSIKLRSQS